MKNGKIWFYLIALVVFFMCKVETVDAASYLKQGSSGKEVREVQIMLKEKGFDPKGVDGRFGAGTKKAVIGFQKRHHLQADGIIGPKTYQVLFSKPKQTTKPISSAKKTVTKTNTKSETSDIVKTAKQFIGVDYRMGGTTPNGFDCSGFVQYVLKQHGKSVPRTASEMYKVGTKTSVLNPGDLVFFQNTYKNGISHVGIYVGSNQFISASNDGVTIKSLSTSYWKQHYAGAKTL